MKIVVQTYYFAGSERILANVAGSGATMIDPSSTLELADEWLFDALSEEYTMHENYFADVNATSCEDNGINLPANLELLPDLTSAYINSSHGGNALYYFNANHLGSGNLITNEYGQVYQVLAYAPHGEILLDHKFYGYSYYEPYRFNGGELDPETKQYHIGARNDDPNLGIWTSTDPLWYMYPDKSSYVSMGNNPIMYVDKDGQKITLIEATKYNSSASGMITRNGISKETTTAISNLLKTKEGLAFFGQFAKKGDILAGHTFTEDGSLSDKELRIVDYTFSEERGGQIQPTDDAASISFDKKSGTVNLRVYSYQIESSDNMTEDILHEATIHGHKTKDALQGQQVTSGAADHRALKNKDTRHNGYRQYKSAQQQLEKLQSKFKSIFQKKEEHYKKVYEDL